MRNYCLPKERPQPYLTLVAEGSSPDYFQTSDMGIIAVKYLQNQTGRYPQVGDYLLCLQPMKQLLSPEQFAERFEVVEPTEHLMKVDELIATAEYGHYGTLTTCVLTLKNGVQVAGQVNPPTSDFLTGEEAEQLAFIEAHRALAFMESHRIAMRYAAQESERD